MAPPFLARQLWPFLRLTRPGRAIAFLLLSGSLINPVAAADDPAAVIPLWETRPPGARGDTPADKPTLTLYPAPAASADRPAPAIVVCPGGGYAHLALDHEGRQIAQWLNSLGITAAVLQYRLAPRYQHPAPMLDVQRALRLVRARADDWHLDPNRVGIIGFSAGGHLASTAGTHFDTGQPDAPDPVDRLSCRPTLMILGYPVISMQPGLTHGGSRSNLLGPNPDPNLVTLLSNELQVTPDTPPAFIIQTDEDPVVPAENSLALVAALRKAKVPVEFHLFEKGPHGLGLGPGAPDLGVNPNAAFSAWPALCESWLRIRGFLPPSDNNP